MKINRLFEIIYLLLNQKTTTAAKLAEHFEVSQRTIYRDVELLSSAGIPIYMTKGKGGGISLLSNFVLNKAVLTDDEKTDILSALYAVDAVNLDQTNSAVQKLSSMFGNTNSDWVEVDFSGWTNPEKEAETFNLIKNAIISKRRVVFHYHSSGGSVSRTVEPVKLCFKGQSWYMYGYCKLREDFRFFKLRRIRELELLDETFDRTAPVKIFNEDNVFQDEFITITLKVSKKMAYRVYDEFTNYEVLSDGSFRAQISIPKGDWIYHYLATFGEECEILEPEYIRLQVIDKLKRTLNQYL